jgi:DNA-binding MarR family transcriptional regulator
MPMLKLNRNATGVPWTKVSNHLFDEIMPFLRDTELRVLLIVIRYTKGWMVPREHVFLSYRMLSKKTGRQPVSIAKAIRELERKGLVERTLELSTERIHIRTKGHQICTAKRAPNKQTTHKE